MLHVNFFMQQGALSPRAHVMANPVGMPDRRAHNPAMAINAGRRSIVAWLIIDTIRTQHAFDTADHATYCSAHHSADRSSAAIALVGAMGEAAGNALRLRRDRQGSECNNCGRNQYSKLHEIVLPMVWMAIPWQGKKGHSTALAAAQKRTAAIVVMEQRLFVQSGKEIPSASLVRCCIAEPPPGSRAMSYTPPLGTVVVS
jgi:hypothetical protein